MNIKYDVEMRTESGPNFSAAHAGPLAQLNEYKFEVSGRTASGKLFIKDFLGLTGMQISMNKLPPGKAVPFYHQHKQNEEAYIFIGGRGQMQVDGTTFDVAEGTIVKITPQGSRCLRNNSDEDLYYICIQAKDGSLTQETFEDGVRSDKPVTWPD